MAVNAKDFEDLKTSVDKLKTNADQAVGALRERMVELKRDHGCDSLKEAKEKLDEKEAAALAAEEEYETAKTEFEQEFADELASVSKSRK